MDEITVLPGVLRLIAILLLVGGVCLGPLDAYGAAKSPVLPEETVRNRLPALAEAVTMVRGWWGWLC